MYVILTFLYVTVSCTNLSTSTCCYLKNYNHFDYTGKFGDSYHKWNSLTSIPNDILMYLLTRSSIITASEHNESLIVSMFVGSWPHMFHFMKNKTGNKGNCTYLCRRFYRWRGIEIQRLKKENLRHVLHGIFDDDNNDLCTQILVIYLFIKVVGGDSKTHFFKINIQLVKETILLMTVIG